MFLHDDELKLAVKEALTDVQEDHFGTVSYDLTIEKIIVPDNNPSELDSYALRPGQTVFVSSEEVLTVPDDCICFVTLRNSCIRMGLDLSVPVYYPGHETRIFARITNISSNEIDLNKGDSVVSLMFNKLDHATEHPYRGKYEKQFDFSKVNEYRSTKLPEIKKLERTAENLKHAEHRIYTNVVTILTIFIGIFGLMNLNLNLAKSQMTMRYLLVYNLVTMTGISLLVTLISLITNHENKKTSVFLSVLTVILFVCTLLVYAL